MQILYLIAVLALLPLNSAFAQQVVSVNQTTACFLNYSAGIDLWKNCGLDDDYIQTALLPWEWITGGNFSLIIVSIFVLVSYIKYHKAIYPIIIGIIIWYIIIHQTKEYSG